MDKYSKRPKRGANARVTHCPSGRPFLSIHRHLSPSGCLITCQGVETETNIILYSTGKTLHSTLHSFGVASGAYEGHNTQPPSCHGTSAKGLINDPLELSKGKQLQFELVIYGN